MAYSRVKKGELLFVILEEMLYLYNQIDQIFFFVLQKQYYKTLKKIEDERVIEDILPYFELASVSLPVFSWLPRPAKPRL